MNGIGFDNAPKLPHKYPHAHSKLGKKWFPFHKLEISLFCYSSIIFLPLVFASGCTDNLHIPYIPETFYPPLLSDFQIKPNYSKMMFYM